MVDEGVVYAQSILADDLSSTDTDASRNTAKQTFVLRTLMTETGRLKPFNPSRPTEVPPQTVPGQEQSFA